MRFARRALAAIGGRRGHLLHDALKNEEARRAVIWRMAQNIPCVKLLKLELTDMQPGSVAMTAENDPQFNGAGTGVHGGILAYVADCVAWFAIVSEVDPKTPMVTTDLQIRYLAACESQRIRMTGRVVKFGRTLCPTVVEMYDNADKHVATANVCYMRLDSQANSAGS